MPVLLHILAYVIQVNQKKKKLKTIKTYYFWVEKNEGIETLNR